MHIKINAGSNAIFVNLEKLLKISFSFHAHTPTVRMHSPKSQNKTLKLKITYLRQQLTSEVSRRYFLIAGILSLNMNTQSGVLNTESKFRYRS